MKSWIIELTLVPNLQIRLRKNSAGKYVASFLKRRKESVEWVINQKQLS